MTSTSQIDEKAVSFLKLDITNNRRLLPRITTLEKIPVWDGEIFLYGDDKQTKNDVKKVPVQVKGKTKGNINSDIFTHSVYKNELQNFSNDGGVIYFVVLIKDNDKHKTYYKMLLPQDIKPILGSFRIGQASKGVKFKAVEAKDLQSLINHFISNRVVNRPIYSVDIIGKTGGFTAKASIPANLISGLSLTQRIETILNHPSTYLYTSPKDFPNELLPISKNYSNFKIFQCNTVIENPTINGKKYNVTVYRVEDDGISKLYIGSNPAPHNRSIVVTEKTQQIDIKIKGTLNQRLNDMDFAVNVFKDSFTVSNKRKSFMSFYEEHKMIRKTFDMLGIKTDIDIESFGENEWKMIHYIMAGLNGEIKNIEKGWVRLKLLEYEFLFLVILVSDKFTFINPFNNSVHFRIANSNGEYANSLFYLQDDGKYLYYRYSNTDYETIYNSLTSCEKTKGIECIFLNTMCKMIDAYDDDNSNLEVLNLALRYGEWLKINTGVDNDMLRLNILQILKRMNILESKDFTELNSMSNSDDALIRFASYTILGDKEKAMEELTNNKTKQLFDTMGIEKQPIFTLYKKL